MASAYKSVPKKLRDLFVPGVVEYDPDVEGQRIRDSGAVALGSRCGPDAFDLPALIHEMAHLVEIDDRRVTHYGWGLRITTCVVVANRRYEEPVSIQAVRRELRVLAFQANVQYAVGMHRGTDDLVRGLTFVPGFTLVSAWSDAERLVWCAGQIERMRHLDAYSYESFEREWHRKVGVIQRRLKRRRRA